MNDLRKEVEELLRKQQEINEKITTISYKLYRSEVGKTLNGLPVESYGPKFVLRYLGYVI